MTGRPPSAEPDDVAFTRLYRQTYWQADAFTRRRIHGDEADLLGRLALDAARSGRHEQMDLVEVLRRLSADQRDALYLTYWEGLPAADAVLDDRAEADLSAILAAEDTSGPDRP